MLIDSEKVNLPFGFAPSAMHCLAHPDGERATSRAAANKGIPMALSTYSTVSLEDVRHVGAGNPYAFQLSIVKDRSTTLSWIKRAEAAGYKALFITVDAPVLGRRLSERSGKKFELPGHLSLPHLAPLPSNDGKMAKARSYHTPGRDPSNSWQSVTSWVKQHTGLEIWLKGSKSRTSRPQTIGKGLGAGYQPISAVLVGAKVHRAIQSKQSTIPFVSGHTYQGRSIGCAAALAT